MPERAPADRPPVAYWAGLAGRLTTALNVGRGLLLLSDFDGTLTPIVRDPTEAWLPLEVREDLRTLAGSGQVTVGIVSGRRLEDLRCRVGLSSIIYAGCHGLEISGLGVTFRHQNAAARTERLADMAFELIRQVAPLAGVLIEPKGLSVAVHYRNASPEVFGPLSEMVGRVVRARPGYTLLSGRKVFEILPAGDWDKGRCVQWIEEQVRARGGSVPTVYLGDDATDELAFSALHGRGITVKVGDGSSTRAACRLQDVADVHRVLSALADHVAAGTTP